MYITNALKRIHSRVTLFAGAAFVPITPSGQSVDAFGSMFGNQADLGSVLNTLFVVAINIGAILAMFRIAWAGWLYMGSADMWSEKQHAKNVFQDAIIGLLILLAIWIILNTINPDILNVSTFLSDLSK